MAQPKKQTNLQKYQAKKNQILAMKDNLQARDDKKKREFWKRINTFRKQIEGKKHYIDDGEAVCDACYKKIKLPHCYDVKPNSTIHLCIGCHNLVKPKRRFVKIIYTPMK